MSEKDLRIFIEHIKDLFEIADKTGQRQSTGFLTLHQQSAIQDAFKYSHIQYEFVGGYKLSERQCLIIKADDDSKVDHKDIMSTIKIVSYDKQAKLGHRDYLGALMNLGIDRSMIGDILIMDQLAYVFVLNHMKDYICEQLFQIGKYKVDASLESDIDFGTYQPSYKEVNITVASIRLDNIIKAAFNLSRTSAHEYIKKGLVFVNHISANKPTKSVEPWDIISARGLGKCRLTSIGHKTKKQRYHVIIHVYQ